MEQPKEDSEAQNVPRQQRSTENIRTEDTITACGSSPRSGSKESRRQRHNQNKIYRTPPTPEPDVLHVRERSFILDSVAVNTTSKEYAKARPKLGQVGSIFLKIFVY